MSMSTSVVGFRPPDEKWRKMKAVYDACNIAGVAPPEEVNDFFEWDTPDDDGVTVTLHNHAAVTEYHEEESNGLQVDLTKLPNGVTIIRFVNSW